MQKLSPGQIGQLIREFFPPKDQTSPTGSSVTQLSVFNDFCHIGALLTDDVQCRMHLAALSKEMAQYLVSGLSHNRLPTGSVRLTGLNKLPQRLSDEGAKAMDRQDPLRPKFFGALQEVLGRHELSWGFAAPASRQQTPVLSGFVHPQSFDDLLLRQARHWKDPGASIEHGEYTHRLQWWIICREHEVGGPYRLNGRPVDLFRQMPDYKTNRWRAAQLSASGLSEGTDHPSFTSVYTDRSMWDFLCDAVPANNAMRDTTPASDSFRSPQFMNLHLTSPMSRDLGLLHAYLVARYNKRTWQFAKKLLRPYKKTLAAKWGLTEEEFDAAFSDSTKYGIEDVMATVDGKVAIPPERSHTN